MFLVIEIYAVYEIYQFEMVQILGNYQMNREAKVWHDLKMIIKMSLSVKLPHICTNRKEMALRKSAWIVSHVIVLLNDCGIALIE